jgi:threonine/homoserine/homoserine lactone efflux protein
MTIPIFLQGILLGFSIAAPVGPIGVLCIRRSLAEGRVSGLVTGLGAATADAVYGSIAAFGLTAVSSLLVGQKFWLSLIGGAFLCYLGIRTFFSKPGNDAASASGGKWWQAYSSTFFLTLTNPMTILSFIAIFSGLGLASGAGSPLSAAILVLGVFLGSSLWWFLLSAGVNIFRSRFKPGALVWVNRVSGVIITAFGLVALSKII